jgi:hypothetical protein
MRRIHKVQMKNQNRLLFFSRQKFQDWRERRSGQISIEPVGDVLDGRVAIERPLHGDSAFWCSLRWSLQFAVWLKREMSRGESGERGPVEQARNDD